MKTNFTEKSLNFVRILLRPLSKLRSDCKNGDKIFQYLYFTRNGIEDRIESAIEDNSNITIVGKPGQGKTSLMHYMFIELQKRVDLYPLIIDYREIGLKNIEGILVDFVTKLRKYFEKIGHPFNQLTEETNDGNCQTHMLKVTNYLEDLSKELLHPKLVIFIDDLDYAQEFYLEVLKKYFLPYAVSDKVVVVLSVRKPLHNAIQSDEQLRHCYYIKPHEIMLPDGNLRLLLHNRLLSVLKYKQTKKESFIFKFVSFLRQETLDNILYKYAVQNGVEIENKDEIFIPKLPFNNSFYAKLADTTFFNLRIIEQILPAFIKREMKGKKPSFNKKFYDAFIDELANENLILLNLVKDKTSGTKKKHRGNAILQNVLEYFYFYENQDKHFYETMSRYGIIREDADLAVDVLTKEPYTLIVPEFVYNVDSKMDIYKHYFINIKGITYVDEILRNNLYYEKQNLTRSKRSYYDDRNRTKYEKDNL